MARILDFLLRAKFSTLWLWVSIGCAYAYTYIGLWCVAWYAGLAVVVSIIEAIWEMHRERA